jgi:tRNA (uracil-5-)-methyltransferase
MTLAGRVAKVVGIEMVQSAVHDAEVNAKLNGLTNIEFRCGKAEDVTATVIRNMRTKRCIAVVYACCGGGMTANLQND